MEASENSYVITLLKKAKQKHYLQTLYNRLNTLDVPLYFGMWLPVTMFHYYETHFDE